MFNFGHPVAVNLKQKGSNMNMSHRVLLPALLLALCVPASADTVSGSIAFHNEVVQIPITITEATDLTIWTDSFGSGGFDPILTLWSGGSLVAYNDDASAVAANQGGWDSVLHLDGITPGTYLLTVTSFNNFANGSTLSDGFLHDATAPVPIGEWWSLGSGNYNVHWVPEHLPFLSAVPEPSSAAMLLAGLGLGCAANRRRRRVAQAG